MALNDVVVALANQQLALLPTPRASEATKGSPNQRGGRGDLTLTSTVIQLWLARHSTAELSTVVLFPRPAVTEFLRVGPLVDVLS